MTGSAIVSLGGWILFFFSLCSLLQVGERNEEKKKKIIEEEEKEKRKKSVERILQLFANKSLVFSISIKLTLNSSFLSNEPRKS